MQPTSTLDVQTRQPIRVLLADDHPIVRKGLRALLEVEDHCRIIGEASDGLTAIELITQLRPEVAAKIQEHVAAMHEGCDAPVPAGRPLPRPPSRSC